VVSLIESCIPVIIQVLCTSESMAKRITFTSLFHARFVLIGNIIILFAHCEEAEIGAVSHLLSTQDMVAVSSTVIPVSSLFGTPKPDNKITPKGGGHSEAGTAQVFPVYRRYSYLSRRSKLFDKSSKPDTPVRLITAKSSKIADSSFG